MPSLSIHAAGLHLNNPVLLAAGILGTTGASLCRAARAGAGGVITKSVGSVPREGHPGSTIVHVQCGPCQLARTWAMLDKMLDVNTWVPLANIVCICPLEAQNGQN
jgi:hypothetical protein